MKQSPLKRKKPLTAKTRLKRRSANPAKKVVGQPRRVKKPSLAKRLQVLNERAKAVMHKFFGDRCMCRGEPMPCTIHHGIRRSQSWYHMFNPRNWHWIGCKCHTIATKEPELYLSMLQPVRPDLVEFVLDTRRKCETCNRTAGNVELIAQWMVHAEACESYEELLALPIWQVMYDVPLIERKD